MKCPICGADNKDSQMYCTSCGAALSGPQSVNIGEQTNEKSSNDITMLTGINISELTKNEPDKKHKKEKPIKIDQEQSKQRFSLFPLFSFLIIVALGVACYYLYLDNKKLKQNDKLCDCPKEECPINYNTIEGIYGLTSNYSFYLPNNWRYNEVNKETLITNDNQVLIIYGTNDGQVDKVTSESLKKTYYDMGYNDAIVTEDVLSQRKIVFVSYKYQDLYYSDFYYQYNSEKFLYGEISSSGNSVITDDIKSIISTISLVNNKNISINKAPVSHDKVFSLLK